MVKNNMPANLAQDKISAMKKGLVLPGILVLYMPINAQTNYRFSFGNGELVKGYIAITPSTRFNNAVGYGFDQGSVVEAVQNDHNHLLTSAYITSPKPFYFSVKLPEGNYDIKLVLGDSKGPSATTVRAECRRLMLCTVRTGSGIVTANITVHIRDSMIRDRQGNITGKLKLKQREYGFLHWDNLLTLEFNDSIPKLSALEIMPNTKASTIFLAGNSTVVDQDREPWAAWGQMLPYFLQAGKVAVANYAESGETLKAFKAERRLDKIWSMAKANDYLLIEFAHNDQKPGSNHLDPFTDYKTTLKEWVTAARSRKMIPVLVTSMHRRNFDSTGHIINTLLDYPAAMRQVATEENVPLIDLNAMSKTLYETWGEENSKKAFVHYPANTFPNQPDELKDNTHFNPYGAFELASCVVSCIRRQHLSLEKFVRKDIPAFDPVKPLPVENFYWPRSALVTALKPDGN
jgi:lysophospholipase L1-like esterase